MKNIRNLIVALLCVLMCAVLFTACQNPTTSATVTPTPSDDNNKEIVMKAGDTYRIFVWSNTVENEQVDGVTGGTRAEETRNHWLKFQEDYGVTITWVASPGGDWLGSVLTAAASQEPICDIYHMGGPFAIPTSLTYGNVPIGTYYENLAAYSEYTDFDNAGRWDQSAQQAVGYYNGQHYIVVPQEEGWGAGAVNQVCFFNKTLLSEGGHNAEEIYNLYKGGEWTFDKMRQIAIDCTNADKNVYGLSIAQNGMAVLSLITANGGAVLTNNANGIPEFSADSAKSLAAINYFLGLCKDDKVVLTENYQNQDEAALFKAGSTAMMLTYANRVQAGEGPRKGAMYQTEGLEYGIVLPPKGPDADGYASDKNWYSPISIFKGHSNPAGVAQCLSMYMGPINDVNSVESQMRLESEATIYFQDAESVQTLKDAIANTVSTSYMAYWTVGDASLSLAAVTTYNIEKWINGETTPEVDYAAQKDALNLVIANTVSGS